MTKDINQLGPYFFWLLPRTIHSPLLRAVELSSFPLEYILYYYIYLKHFYDKSYQHTYNSFLYNQGICKVFNVLLYFDDITYGRGKKKLYSCCTSIFLFLNVCNPNYFQTYMDPKKISVWITKSQPHNFLIKLHLACT